jgi:molybdopterin-guanine dinucleotide biosynthesis protein A
MGTDKAMLKWEGQLLIARAVGLAREAGASEVFISSRPGADYSALACPVLVDLVPGKGPMGGIERGLFSCRNPFLLVLAVDLPRMTSHFLRSLFARCDDKSGIVPSLNNRIEPLVAIYPRHTHALASGLLAKGHLAARDFAELCLREKAVQAFPVRTEDEPCFANWNCPGDFPER